MQAAENGITLKVLKRSELGASLLEDDHLKALGPHEMEYQSPRAQDEEALLRRHQAVDVRPKRLPQCYYILLSSGQRDQGLLDLMP